MGRRAGDRDLGDKLGPRLADVIAHTVVATRRGLATHEAKVHAAGLQQVIDRAGLEVAEHHRDLIHQILAADDSQPDWLTDYLGRTASGHHQWQAISGVLGLTGVTGGLGTIMTNYLAPAVQQLVGASPQLQLDQNAAATAAARGILSRDLASHYARQAGFPGDQFNYLFELAQTPPDLQTLIEMHNRGLLPQDGFIFWLMRSGIAPGVAGNMQQLTRNLLSPADAALAVLRGTLTEAEGRKIAGQNGIASYDFDTLVANTGEPLGLMQLLEAYRRNIIGKARLERGVIQSRVRNEWLDVAEALRYSPVSAADAIDAWQRGHLPQDQAVTIAEANGVLPAQVPILLANAGNPLAIEQLLELWRRGEITEAQVDSGIRQGRTRTDWLSAAKKLRYVRMSTADAIDAWQRGHISQDAATAVAEENGTMPADVPILLANAGNPLALEQLLELWRRGYITEAQVDSGIRAGRTRNDWLGPAKHLRYQRMSTADAITASVQSHITKAEAKVITTQNGLNPDDFEPLWETAGEPLSRTELEQLFNRGLISEADVKQGLKESRLKDKYVDHAFALHTRLPEARVITEAIGDGVLSRAAGIAKLRQIGYAADDAAMLVALGETRSTGGHRLMMAGEITRLYGDRIITAARATELLGQAHYSGETAALMLALADYQVQQRILNSGLAGIKAHYLAHRIDDTEATADLLALNLPAETATLYLKVWKLDRLASPKQLTQAQVIKAVKLGLLVDQGTMTKEQWEAKNQEAGHDRLVKLGYAGDDADLLLAGA